MGGAVPDSEAARAARLGEWVREEERWEGGDECWEWELERWDGVWEW